MDQNQEYTTFGRQVGYTIGANIALVILTIVQFPILTKGLGANLYGMWSLINVTISIILPFAVLSFSSSIVRFLAAEKEMSRIKEDFLSAYSIVFLSGIVFSLLLFFLSHFLAASIFKDVNSASYIKLASVLILLNSLHLLPSAFFRMRRKIGLDTILNLIYSASRVGLIVLFILLGYKLTGVIAATIICGILFDLIALTVVLRQTGLKVPRFSRMKSYLRWGVPLTPNSVIGWIINSSDIYMVSYFLGVTAAGIYSSAYRIASYASWALIPLGIVLFPTIAKYYDEGNLNKVKNYLKYSTKYLMMIAIPSAFGLSMLAKPLLQILTTPEFVSGSIVVPFVTCGAVLLCFRQIFVYIIHLVGKTEITVRTLSISAALNVGLNLLLIPRMGILGAAIATVIAYVVLVVLMLIATRKYLRFDLNLPFIGKSFFSSVIMVLCIWLISPQSIAMVIGSIFAGAAIYFGVLFLIKGLSKRELAFFAIIIKNNMRRIGA